MSIFLFVIAIVLVAVFFYWSVRLTKALNRTLKQVLNKVASVESLIDKERAEISYLTKRNEVVSRNLYHQILAAHDIESLAGGGLTRNLRGWAISPDAMMVIVNFVLKYKPEIILELGGGYSTVILDRVIKRYKLPTIIISVDHKNEYIEQTAGLVGATNNVEYVLAELVEDDGYAWYNTKPILKVLGKRKANLMIVDGPPESTNKYARLPALARMRGGLSKDYAIILDDAGRGDERHAVDTWLSADKRLNHTYIETEKGLSVVTTNDSLRSHELL